MPVQQHPETGEAYRSARDSLLVLLVVTVALGGVVNALVSHLWAAGKGTLLWWAGLAALVVLIVVLVPVVAWLDDRRIGRAETRVDLLLCYVVRGRTKQVEMGVRGSYAITRLARDAWRATFRPHGLSVRGRPGLQDFAEAIHPEHIELVRHLLVWQVADFGERLRPHKAPYGFLQLNLATHDWPWEDLDASVRENRFAVATRPAAHDLLTLPLGADLRASAEGDVLLEVQWKACANPLCQLLARTGRAPGGVLRVRHVGKLSQARRFDTPFEDLTARLKNVDGAELHIVVTRLIVEVETHWNALEQVGRFRDWGINLAEHLRTRMSYNHWRQGFLQRTIGHLDWKIGRMERDEPGLAQRLKDMDDRSARLEAHLWPDEPPQGGSEGAWLEGPEERG